MICYGDYRIIVLDIAKAHIPWQSQAPSYYLWYKQFWVENPFFGRNDLENIVNIPTFWKLINGKNELDFSTDFFRIDLFNLIQFSPIVCLWKPTDYANHLIPRYIFKHWTRQILFVWVFIFQILSKYLDECIYIPLGCRLCWVDKNGDWLYFELPFPIRIRISDFIFSVCL